ncbi:hypothetical protein IFM89_001084 [Coptis chinensis]|uniref:PGG domain-containing protein n=1 Tax=Coptis chinensis TaxID=261450 RepID=A0A835LL38_9MAGN|nr:hypothetical protein IFM89_001084 [Coptis chinensis]
MNGETPQEVFAMNHKDLAKAGEHWMKETAGACITVAILVATVVFAAAFTVPGGLDNDTGAPYFKDSNLLMFFIISDTLSLFTSCTSLLMLIAIFTSSRYREEDFLISLPKKWIIGVTTLLISIASMMVAFCASLFIVLHHSRFAWVAIPCTLLASVPLTLFILLQFPLLVEVVSSTYGPSIFRKTIKRISY